MGSTMLFAADSTAVRASVGRASRLAAGEVRDRLRPDPPGREAGARRFDSGRLPSATAFFAVYSGPTNRGKAKSPA